MDTDTLGGIGKLSRARLSQLVREFSGCITTSDASEYLHISKAQARRMLGSWTDHGWLRRVRAGVYVPVELAAESPEQALSNPWEIATRLFAPCYIGGWSACQHWGFTEQIFDTTVVLSTSRVRAKEELVGNMKFFMKKCASEKFFGLKSIWKDSVQVQVSDPHKTIIDMFDDPTLAGGIRSLCDIFQSYLKSEYCNFSTLIEYAERMGNKTIFKRMGYLVSVFRKNETTIIDLCLDHLSKGYSQIDSSSKGYKLVKKWRLWVPEDFEKIVTQLTP